eukprot:NODE_126_length_18761_cov_0.476262.p9 type:complete len:167 gc:universal NODE_126_length_18761_cov_0.476262:16970-16470(-)
MPASDDLLFEELENEDFSNAIYENRILQLKKQCAEQAKYDEFQCGQYTYIKNDEDILKLTTTLPKVVLHFRHPDFKLCQEMDQHLTILAKKYPKTKFGYCHVMECSFIVEKFNIKVLPHLVVFHNSIAKKQLIGYDEFGVHNVETKHIEECILNVYFEASMELKNK